MLQVEEISKSYDKKEVVKNISFGVGKGESFGLLGPNGAGKSTLIGMMAGLVAPNQGDITVSGYSVTKQPLEVKKKIGVVPQEIALYPTLSARENLMFWGKMHGLSSTRLKQRVNDVLELVGLRDREKEKIETFSGGMKRRINIAASLLHEPELLIMDEPTVGIDPQSRNHILETVKALNEKGLTVIYTSHYMEEVEFLCSRIAIVDHGSLLAIGSKQDLIDRLAGGTAVHLKLAEWHESFLTELQTVSQVSHMVPDRERRELDLYVHDHQTVISEIIACAAKHHVLVSSFEVKEPNLEALFLSLTGRTLRD